MLSVCIQITQNMSLLWHKVVIFLVVIVELHNVSDAKKIPTYMKNYFFNAIENAAGRTQCASDLKSLIHDLMNKKRWALEMIDSSGKLTSGLLAGHIAMTGSFDQCIEISEQKNHTLIAGQYCTVLLSGSKENPGPLDFLGNTATLTDFLGVRLSKQSSDVLKVIKLNYGLCIPHSCSIGNLQKIWDYVENTFKAPVHLQFEDMLCRSKEKEIDAFSIDKYIISVFVVYIVILIVCTWYDLVIHQQIEGKKDNYIVAFSLFTNAKKLFSSTSSSPKETGPDLKSISGIKVICMLWAIYGHRTILNFFSGITNTVYVHQLRGQVEVAFIIAASYAVDSFFVLSGLLLSYGIFKNQDIIKKRKQFPVIPLYLYRLLRLIPALLAAVLFYVSIFKKLSDGPKWPQYSRKLAGSCALNGWATLLFVSNYLNIHHQCLEQSWFISVDSQLFLLAPIILIYFLKKPWKTSLVCIGVCILSGIYTFVITIQNEYGAIYVEGNVEYFENIYTSTLVRMPPWFIGLVFGFLIYKYQDLKIPLVTNIFLWACTLALLLSLILVHLIFTRSDEYNAIGAALFNSCARQAWGLVVGTMVFLCSTGHGGRINEWLSLPVFQVLVRLSYSVYLVQVAVILYFVGSKRHSDHFGYMKLTHDFMGDLVFIFFAATIWCLAFESPFLVIGKMVYKKAIEESSSDQSSEETKRKKKGYVVCVYKYEEGDKTTKKLK